MIAKCCFKKFITYSHLDIILESMNCLIFCVCVSNT